MTERQTLFQALRKRRRNTFGKAYPYVSYDELQRIIAALDAAHAWLEHYDRGKLPAGSRDRLERWYAERDAYPEFVREALNRV